MKINDLLKKVPGFDFFLTREMKRLAGKELLKEILDLCEGDESEAREFFYTPCALLEEKRPYDLCKKGEIEKVKQHVERLKYGVF